MAVIRDHQLREHNPNHFRYLVNELLDHLTHAHTLYAIKLKGDGLSVTPAQVTADSASLHAAYDYCAEQVETLLVELLRYQQWTAKPIQPDV